LKPALFSGCMSHSLTATHSQPFRCKKEHKATDCRLSFALSRKRKTRQSDSARSLFPRMRITASPTTRFATALASPGQRRKDGGHGGECAGEPVPTPGPNRDPGAARSQPEADQANQSDGYSELRHAPLQELQEGDGEQHEEQKKKRTRRRPRWIRWLFPRKSSETGDVEEAETAKVRTLLKCRHWK
jgi:hypothetical protein